MEAVLAQFLSEADCCRLVMAYDFKGAHRLVQEEWGKQAFRLEDSDTVYVNCVGTFGEPPRHSGGRGWPGPCSV